MTTGARAYYMHSVLHDWPDEVAATILGRVKDAMRPGYSRLLINENVIPPEHAQWEAARYSYSRRGQRGMQGNRVATQGSGAQIPDDFHTISVVVLLHSTRRPMVGT